MGAHPNTYIGIYLEVPQKLIEVKTPIKIRPSTGKKVKNPVGNFDPHTGEKYENGFHTEMQWVGVRFDSDLFFEPAYTDKKRVSTFVLQDNYDNCSSELFNFPLNDISPSTCIEEFKTKHIKYLQYIESQGFTYTVNYGVVVYAH